jgi:NADH:ubiquinone oxidoreductase subunit 2 (subunit N)
MNYMLALPEIFLAAAGLALLMLGVFLRGETTERIAWLSVLVLIVTGILLLWAPPPGTQTAFQGLYVVDQFAQDGFTIVVILPLRIMYLEFADIAHVPNMVAAAGLISKCVI